MFLDLSATVWCNFLAISPFLAISAQKTDTVPTESISSNAGLSWCTHRLYLCWTISREIKQWSGAGGSNKRSWYECENVKIAGVTFGSLSCFSCLFVLQSNISLCKKRECGRERGNENVLRMGSGTATMQASSDLEARCSEIPEAQPLLKENNFFAIHMRLCVMLLVYIGCMMKWGQKPLCVCVCESRIPQGLWQQCQKRSLKGRGKGPLSFYIWSFTISCNRSCNTDHKYGHELPWLLSSLE